MVIGGFGRFRYGRHEAYSRQKLLELKSLRDHFATPAPAR